MQIDLQPVTATRSVDAFRLEWQSSNMTRPVVMHYRSMKMMLMDALAVQRKGARVEMERACVPEWTSFEDDEL